jgi:hypothetical protein
MATIDDLMAAFGINPTSTSTSNQTTTGLQYQQQQQALQSLLTQMQQQQSGSTSQQDMSGYQNQLQNMSGTNWSDQAGTNYANMAGSTWGDTWQNQLANMAQQSQTQGQMGQTSQMQGTTQEQMQQQAQGTSQQQYQYGLGPIDPLTQATRQFTSQLMPTLANRYFDPMSDPMLQAQRQSALAEGQRQYTNLLKPTYDTLAQKSGMYGSTPWAQQSVQGAQDLTTRITKELNDAALRQQDTALQGMLSGGQILASSGAQPVMMSSTGQNQTNTTGSTLGQTSSNTNTQGWNTGTTNTTGQTATSGTGGYTGGQTQNTLGGYSGSTSGGMNQSMLGQSQFGQTGTTNTQGWSNSLSQALNQGMSSSTGLGMTNQTASGQTTAPSNNNVLGNILGGTQTAIDLYGLGSQVGLW